ncbi:MAG: hypothetical protein R2729_07780 [Bryobacteraceae bacterium]
MKYGLWAIALCAASAWGQQWEVGALGGGSFYLNNSVTGAGGATGTTGFRPGLSAGGWIGHTNGGKYGGEIRYLFQRNDLKVNSGGQSYNFAGQSHVIHYDFVYHMKTSEDAFRPFVAVGGGLKGYRGTGKEQAFQPLSNLAILSQTSEWKPMLTFGAGVKWQLSNRILLRAEIRDFVTPFPKSVILPSPGAKIAGWVHDITPLFGISYLVD